MKIIPREDRGLGSRFNMKGRNPPSEGRGINDVVMDERRGMEDLGGCGKMKLRRFIALVRDPLFLFQGP